MKILVTGGAGFVGSSLAFKIKEETNATVHCLDNLYRKGSELNLEAIKKRGCTFIYGDIRNPNDIPSEEYTHIIDCAAEPSVQAGYTSSPTYSIQTNLVGTLNLLEKGRKTGGQLIFISTSRVYPTLPLINANIRESDTRYDFEERQTTPGISSLGISEDFPLVGLNVGPRSIYGSTKLASELVCQEYNYAYDIPITTNRCGVITGPGQLAKADQGIFAYWCLCHILKKPLKYIGFGGSGKQVRDLIHVEDLAELVLLQMLNPIKWGGKTFNLGGGRKNSLSLLETTKILEDISGKKVDVSSSNEERKMDIPVYYSDNRNIESYETSWKVEKQPRKILEEIFVWGEKNKTILERALF
jgi:CDP-paratose 2-epimerase